MGEERNAAKTKLQKRIQERMEKKKNVKKADLERQAMMRIDAEEKEQLSQVVEAGTKDLQDSEKKLIIQEDLTKATEVASSAKTSAVPQADNVMAAAAVMATGASVASVEDVNMMLMESSFFKELQAMEGRLKESLEKKDDDTSEEPKEEETADDSTPFIDIYDAQWLLTGKLQEADVHNLSASQSVVFRFGTFIVDMLSQVLETGKITLLLAHNIPDNKYMKNAFRHSVFYDELNRRLYVRTERLSSVGDFVMVVIHSMAHVAAKQMNDDTDPYFLRAFFKALKITCEDLFMARIRSQKSSSDTKDVSLLGASSNMQEKTALLNDLIDLKVIIPSSVKFSDGAIQQRLRTYSKVDRQGTVQQVISSHQSGIPVRDPAAHQRLVQLDADGIETIPLPMEVSPKQRIQFMIRNQVRKLREQLDDLNQEIASCVKVQAHKSPVSTSQLDALTQQKEEILQRIQQN